MKQVIKIPSLGDAENTEVIEICVNPGDSVGSEDSIVVLESEKAAMDVPASKNGVVKKVLVKIGDEVKEGDDFLEIEITEEEMILDLSIEEKTLSLINDAKTILWNGPVGVFENDLFAEGTRCLSKAISKSKAFSLAGGGETLSAINKYINPDDVSYCSTGGGAFLEFMEGKTLPSIKALNLKEIRS